MSKLTNYQNKLIEQAKQKLHSCRKRHDRIVAPINYHLQYAKNNNFGYNVLEHFLEHKLDDLENIHYFEGEIYDLSHQKSIYFSKTNRKKEWRQVKHINYRLHY